MGGQVGQKALFESTLFLDILKIDPIFSVVLYHEFKALRQVVCVFDIFVLSGVFLMKKADNLVGRVAT